MQSHNLDIKNITKGALPRVPFADLKHEILGDAYELSISIVSPAEIKKLSLMYKGDDTHRNILSFPLNESMGEIILNPTEIKKEAPKFGTTFEKHLKYIVIHGMLHLAGHTHGSKMEQAEKRLLVKFS